MADLLELAERCEKATGPDRELDVLIADATGRLGMEGWEDVTRDYTTSLDAAITLVPLGWTLSLDQWPARTMKEAHERPGDWGWGIDDWRATLTEQGGKFAQTTSVARSPALALVAAALRARSTHG